MAYLVEMSYNVFSLIGKRVQLVKEFEGYKVGDKAIVDEIAFTSEGPFCRLRFEPIPGSLEEIKVWDLPFMIKLVGRQASL